jgi:hypothetical protein
MKKNIIIIPCGDNSLHTEWISNNSNFDIGIIYYGSDEDKFNEYSSKANFSLKLKGEKWFLINEFLDTYKNKLNKYEYFWFPDDDLKGDVDSVNKLFDLNKTYNLELSQPSLDGHISHEIVKHVYGNLLRYTNFVEIICPLMSYSTVLKLKHTFTLTQSGWGVDFLWTKLLNNPTDKIAIIDDVIITHTKPVGSDYSRLNVNPMDELNHILRTYNLTFSQYNISSIKK